MQSSMVESLAKSKYWSDFNKLYLHPKTIVEIPHVMHRNFEEPMQFFEQGVDVLSIGLDTVKTSFLLLYPF